MTREPSPLRAYSVAAAIALVLFGGWHSWKTYQQAQLEKDGKRRDRLLWRADSLYRSPSDSFCKRMWSDTLVHRDGLGWFAARSGLPLRKRGLDDGWQGGGFGTPDSGIVIFLALDSGCATGGKGGLWNHACRLYRQSWDIPRKTGGSPQNVSHSRSLWAYPGEAKVCPLPTRPDPPTDSVVAERCGCG